MAKRRVTELIKACGTHQAIITRVAARAVCVRERACRAPRGGTSHRAVSHPSVKWGGTNHRAVTHPHMRLRAISGGARRASNSVELIRRTSARFPYVPTFRTLGERPSAADQQLENRPRCSTRMTLKKCYDCSFIKLQLLVFARFPARCIPSDSTLSAPMPIFLLLLRLDIDFRVIFCVLLGRHSEQLRLRTVLRANRSRSGETHRAFGIFEVHGRERTVLDGFSASGACGK